jgi:outer membrane protein OmpA-like peptidoglycan-associated protein
MTLKAKATEQATEAFLHYDLGQLQTRLGVLFTPTLIRKKQADYLGVRQPAMKLVLDAGLSYNFYTSATRTLINDSGNVTDLKAGDEFEESYPAYIFGAGLEFPINKHTTLYGKYEIENSFSINEDGQNSGFEEEFDTHKRRLLFGLRIDFALKNQQKRQQLDRIAALEAKNTEELLALQQKVAELEQTINSGYKYDDTALQKHLQNKDIHLHETHKNGVLFAIEEEGKEGLGFLPTFRHVLFPHNSSYFEKNVYASKLSDLAQFLKKNNKYRIKLVGHAATGTGSSSYNKTLSAERAKRVYDHLIKLGVPSIRMEHSGFGETSKFNRDEKSENRRTEILITE